MPKFALAAAALAALVSAPSFAQPPAGAGDAPGPVTRAEVEQMNKDRFAAMDANKDGFVTAAELGAAAGPERAARMIERLDTDKDGKVSAAELSQRMLGMFDLADANHDGTLTPEEQAAARDARRARMQAPAAAPAPAPHGH
ncbi:MAG TPA: EF-hand domain-containing protein [Allosphingosinicella sp.]